MDFVIAVFRARTDTMTFASLLRSYGVAVNIINTPRQINVSCGISARFDMYDLIKAKDILSRRRFDSFDNFYHVSGVGSRTIIRRI